jgi:hypothetical protein
MFLLSWTDNHDFAHTEQIILEAAYPCIEGSVLNIGLLLLECVREPKLKDGVQ